MRSHRHPPEWLKLRRLTTPNVGADAEKLEFPHAVGGSVKYIVQPLWKIIWQFFYKTKQTPTL